jgi:hypothetical protein
MREDEICFAEVEGRTRVSLTSLTLGVSLQGDSGKVVAVVRLGYHVAVYAAKMHGGHGLTALRAQ